MSNREILKELETKRTKCVVYTRVMGYHRPTETFNIGKKGEFRQRTHFIENHEREKIRKPSLLSQGI